MDIARRSSWSKGSNNLARPGRLVADAAGDSAARKLLNLDVGADGVPTLRAPYAMLRTGSDVRALFSVRDYLVYADGAELRSLNTVTNEAALLGSLRSTAPLAGAVLNDTLYLSSATDSLRTDGMTLKAWGVTQPGLTVSVTTGQLRAGVYKVAATAVGPDGEESGASVVIIRVPDGSGLLVSTADVRPLRLYAGVANSSTLYYQRLLLNTTTLSSVGDASERLTTDGLVPLGDCDGLAAHHSVLVGHKDNCVVFTSPMHPHLTDPLSGFFQYGAKVDAVAATDGGVYVLADKTYFLTGLETATPQQRVVLATGGVAGSVVALPDGRVSWFTRYGQAMGDPSGAVVLMNKDTYAPDLAARGAAGLIEYNGHQMVVTTLRGITSPNNLATGDFAELET